MGLEPTPSQHLLHLGVQALPLSHLLLVASVFAQTHLYSYGCANVLIFSYCSSQMMDSAPLSASLLADWMDVTGNMDPQALDEIQQELSSALDDFPFSNY